MKMYNLNCGDMFGRDDRATELYNNNFIPLLKKLGIKKEKDLDNINEGFDFDINNGLLNRHRCIIFTHKVNGNTIYIGTTKQTVAFQIVKTLTEKMRFWQARKERFLENFYKDKD